MPVPDMQPRFRDFAECQICGKCYPDDNFNIVVVDNEKDGAANEKRILEICKPCRENCRNYPAFEESVTEKVIRLRLGRKIKILK